MGRLEELRINAYLSEIARGYGNNSFIADKLFPTINSEKEKIDIFEFNKEAFQIYDTERAIRANSNVISPKGFNKHSATLKEHDLAYPIDYREEEEAEKIKLQVHATNVVTQGLYLKHEKQCADLAQNPDNYALSNKSSLSGTSKFSDDNSDPVGVIDDAKDRNLLNATTYSLLYAADFADRLENQIIPALKSGFIVLLDRYYYTALARDVVRGQDIEWVKNLYDYAPEPDLVFYLDMPVDVLLKRIIGTTGLNY